MTRYHVRATLDISDRQEETIRTERDLAPDAPLIHTVRDEVHEALAAAGVETGHWGDVLVT